MVENAPVISQVLPEFLKFIADDPLVAHNASFDTRILNEHITALGYNTLSNMLIDTLRLSRKIDKAEKVHKLKAVIKRLSIEQPHKERHRALEDAEYVAMIFLKFLGVMKQHDIITLEDISRFCNSDCDIEDFRQLQLF